MRFLMIAALAIWFSTAASAQLFDDFVYEETRTIPALSERPITFYLDHPTSGPKVPLLVLVDGSGCVGQLRPGNRYDYRPGPAMPARYARLMVEKPGVDPQATARSACTDAFKRDYSIADRVSDHLRVLQHLRGNADWWNGDVYLWGWSDGGDIAAQILVSYPSVRRAVLGAMGGGLTMAEHFEQFWACPADAKDRKKCLADLRKDFRAIEDGPSRIKQWSGESYRTWDSRLRTRLIAPLSDNRVPILIVHGELDRENTPVESARALVDGLEAANNTAFTYWEVTGMEHGWGKLAKPDQARLRLGMLNWLFGRPPAASELPALTTNSRPRDTLALPAPAE